MLSYPEGSRRGVAFLTPHICFLCSVPFQDIVIKGKQGLLGPKRTHGHVMDRVPSALRF